MKNSSLILNLRSYAGGAIRLLCPEWLNNWKVIVFRLIRNIFSYQCVSNEKIISLGHKGKHVFFGYYDITPFSGDDRLVLAMHAPLINRAPCAKDEAEIGVYDIQGKNSKFVCLGKTNTWCWQQGCRLQWYPGRENEIIYNCMIGGQYGAVIKKFPSGSIIKTINKPLYSINKDGQWGLSLDFSRLQRLRPGYGYGILPDKSADDFKPSYGGIELVNLETNEVQQLFSLKQISQIEPHDSMNNAEHYFNHLMFNPLGNKFLFFHLWMSQEGKRYSRLFVSDKDGSNLKLLNNSGSVSHYNWIDEDEIILYSYIKDEEQYMYAIFDCNDGNIKYFGKNIPKGDGHPALLKNKKNIITDTYPDLCVQRNLLSYNVENDETKIIARFDSPSNFKGEFRCDLHPRVNNSEKMICVDRFIDNKRNISLIPIEVYNL